MTRRGMIGATLAAAPASVMAVPATLAPEGRPPFHLEPVSATQWRFRSWTWANAAWRPLTGNVSITGDDIVVAGSPDARDSVALQAALADIARDRSGNKAR